MFVSFFSYIALAVLFLKFAGIKSFPMAHSISTFCTTMFILTILTKRFGSFLSTDLFKFGLRLLVVTICTGVVFYSGSLLFSNFTRLDLISKLVSFCVPSALGFLGFIVSSIVFKLGDWHFFTNLIKPRKQSKMSNDKHSPLVILKDVNK
jgi:peptidoglycan biosynthesis protein MviN/MurJ (putative lipid II flippase)